MEHSVELINSSAVDTKVVSDKFIVTDCSLSYSNVRLRVKLTLKLYKLVDFRSEFTIYFRNTIRRYRLGSNKYCLVSIFLSSMITSIFTRSCYICFDIDSKKVNSFIEFDSLKLFSAQ